MKNLIKIVLLASALGAAGMASAAVIENNQKPKSKSEYSARWEGLSQYGQCNARECSRLKSWHKLQTPRAEVPEPATLALLGAGLFGLSLAARRRKAN